MHNDSVIFKMTFQPSASAWQSEKLELDVLKKQKVTLSN